MKKITFLLAIIFTFSTVLLTAQTEKGKIFLQGSSDLDLYLGKSKTKTGGTTNENYKYIDVSFRPMAGYTIINNLPIGAFLSVDLYKNTYPDDSYDKGTSLVIGPFARYYFLDLGNFKPLAEVAIGVGVDNSKYKNDYSNGEVKNNSFYMDSWAGVGGTYFITDNVGIDGTVGYEYESYKHKAEDNPASRGTTTDYTYLYGSFYVYIGVVVMLGD